MPRIVDIKIPGMKIKSKAHLSLDFEVHQAFRTVVAVERRHRDISGLMADMIMLYVETKHPDLIVSVPKNKKASP